MKKLILALSLFCFSPFIFAMHDSGHIRQNKGYRISTLHSAVEANNLESVRSLLTQGASVKDRNMWGRTPLESARRQAASNRELLDKAKENDPFFYKFMGKHVREELSRLSKIIVLLEDKENDELLKGRPGA